MIVNPIAIRPSTPNVLHSGRPSVGTIHTEFRISKSIILRSLEHPNPKSRFKNEAYNPNIPDKAFIPKRIVNYNTCFSCSSWHINSQIKIRNDKGSPNQSSSVMTYRDWPYATLTNSSLVTRIRVEA